MVRLFARGAGRWSLLLAAGSARWCLAQHVGLHEVVPSTCPAHLHDMDRELFLHQREPRDLLVAARRARDRAEPITEYPRYEGELFLTADRADNLAGAPVELRRPQEVGARIAGLGDSGPPRVDVGEDGATLERVVHGLPLRSHGSRVRRCLAGASAWWPFARAGASVTGRTRGLEREAAGDGTMEWRLTHRGAEVMPWLTNTCIEYIAAIQLVIASLHKQR